MPTVQTPVLHMSYPSDTDGNFLFWLHLPYISAVSDPADLDFQLQIDNQTNFASPNLRTYTKGSTGGDLVDYQDGDFVKAWEVTLPWRLRNETTQTWYYRVRINDAVYDSAWTAYKTLTIRADYSNSIMEDLIDSLADENVYVKEAYSTNVAMLYKSLGKELDKLQLEYELTQDDNYVDLIRDSAIEDNFGQLIGLERTAAETATEYRFRVRTIWDAFVLNAGVEQGIKDVVRAFTGIDPLIIDNSDQYGWILGRHYLPDPNHPDLTPTIRLYSRRTKGYGISIYIYNHWALSIDAAQIEAYVNSIKPAHVKCVFIYP